VIDLGDRKIIGWALSVTMKAIDTVIPEFKMAQKNTAYNAGADLSFRSWNTVCLQ
jgi:hypothetical protein